MASKVKDPAWLLLWHGFDPWSRNFHMPKSWLKKKKKKKKGERKEKKEKEMKLNQQEVTKYTNRQSYK